MNDVMSKIRTKKPADKFKAADKFSTTKDSLLNRTMSTAAKMEQPDIASLTKQTLHDIPKNMPAAKMQIRSEFLLWEFSGAKNINIDIPDKKSLRLLVLQVVVNRRCCVPLIGCMTYIRVCGQKAISILMATISWAKTSMSICYVHKSVWSFRNRHRSRCPFMTMSPLEYVFMKN